MRIQTMDDINAQPSALVREQDFVLNVRRLYRTGSPFLVANVTLSTLANEGKGDGPLEGMQDRLRDMARRTGATYAEMSNGDIFLVWNAVPGAEHWPREAWDGVLAKDVNIPDLMARTLFIYNLPTGYSALRERINHYVETSRAAALAPEGPTPAEVLRGDSARGPLTAWTVDQIGRLLGQIDLRRFLRAQTIYIHRGREAWGPLSEEYFIGFEELRKTYFPRLEVAESAHFFLAICQILDQRLLEEMALTFELPENGACFLNLTVPSIMGSAFARFAHAITPANRGRIGFELNSSDVFQDISLTLYTITEIRREGFLVALDGVRPNMLPYFNAAKFDVDYIKVNVSKGPLKDRAAQLKGPAVQRALAALPREKIIFFRCDSEEALALGLKMGVTKFQGWLIDDKARLE